MLADHLTEAAIACYYGFLACLAYCHLCGFCDKLNGEVPVNSAVVW
jgi:hypothetical protein